MGNYLFGIFGRDLVFGHRIVGGFASQNIGVRVRINESDNVAYVDVVWDLFLLRTISRPDAASNQVVAFDAIDRRFACRHVGGQHFGRSVAGDRDYVVVGHCLFLVGVVLVSLD